MPLVKVKPTSPGRRQLVKLVNPDLHKGGPYPPLVEKQSRKAGRNVNGHITMRHQGGGHKQHYRIVDFRRDKDGISAKVERLEYDPNRSANLALLCYADGERRYIIAAKGLAAGTQLLSGAEAPIKPGNEQHSLESIGKAGRVRWRGVRPTVRGVAMNPIDHPHGGGEGKTAAGQDPVSPWGVLTKGYKTRKNKRTRGMIIQFRHKKRDKG